MSPKDQIADFYDSHPYPPPVEDLSQSLHDWDETERRVEYFRHWPTLPYRGTLSILVAGCGTSQAARWAARYPEADVVGIDVSPSSLESQRRLKDQHNLSNLDLIELPIEDLASLERDFDLVVCTGVLHHLADPTLGLRTLRDVLRPDGAIHLMVYARYGRQGVAMIRDYASRLGVQPIPESIEDLTKVLKEVPTGHPISHLLRGTPDFGDPDALADALLNPREVAYSVPELFDWLAAGGMRFGRWIRQAPYRPQVGIMAHLPHGEALADMSDLEQFAAMELFRGTIVRHSLIAIREDSELSDLHWDDWASFVPLVPRTVVVVEEGLPTGKAAAVINRAHTDTDLVCLLDREQLEVFRAIHGQAPLADIPGATPMFFERLWLHDLVVVNASG